MSLNIRRFSQIQDDTTSPESTRIFADSRSSLSSSEGYERKSKRRRTTGLNSRFDHMIEAMNATYHPVQRAGRRRTHTASSSNTSDIPQTQMDAYEGLEEGRLGENFSLIKMKPPYIPGVAPRIEYQAGASSVNTPKTLSMDPTTNPLPQWLCSTFSSLAAKHPLRLLLPKKPSIPQGTAMMLSSVAVDSPKNPVRREPDPIFAFPTHQRSEIILGGQSTKHLGTNEDEYRIPLSPDIPRSSPSMNPLVTLQMDSLPSQSPPPRLRHVLSSLQIQPFSTPGPNSVLSQPSGSATMLSSTSGINEMDAQGHGLPPGFDELDFVPFSTPGPGSTLSSVPESDTLPNGLPPRLELPSQVHSINDTNSAPSPRVLPYSVPGPLASHVDQPITINRSPHCPPSDLCLPPYNAAPSDPTPAYSSDDIPEYSYYEDPTTEDSDSEPPQDHHFLDVLNLPNIFATPGPGYCAPRPIYFDSPTEGPSDSDPLQSGYEIDYGAIDFQWASFNRKSVGENQITPSIGPHYDTHLRPRIADHEATCAGMTQQARDLNLALTPERVPSPSPFRFSPNQDVSRNTVISSLTYTPHPQADQLNIPEPQTLAPAFAPTPGIYISPLRGESTGPMPHAPVRSLPPLTHHAIDGRQRRVLGSVTAQSQKASRESSTPSNSQTSHDSIESWRDVDVKVLL